MSKKYFFTDKNGDVYPEWESARIEDLFKVTRGKVIAKPSLSPIKTKDTPYPVYSSQTSNSGILGWSSTYDFEGRYLTWTTDGANAGRVFARNGKFRCTNVCGVLVEKEHSIGFANSALSELLNPIASKHVMRGLGNPKLMSDVMSKVAIPLPSLAEQQKIAEFFSALDERIALTAGKVKLLKEQQQGYLQKVFSRELVFTDGKGDTYAEWEHKKLDDIAGFINGFAFKPDDLGSDGTPVVKIKELLDPSDLSVKTLIDVPKSLHLKNGDIILSWSMTLACRIWNGGPAILNQHLYKVVGKENTDSRFLNYLLNNELSGLRNLMHGGTAKHITRKDLLPYKVKVPSLPEQKKIGEFFSALDEQIELTENRLALLKEQKKGYLQGIFG